MGWFRRAEKAEAAMSIGERLWALAPGGTGALMAAIATKMTAWLDAWGPIAWLFAALLGALVLSAICALGSVVIRNVRRSQVTSASGQPTNLKPLIEAFEQHAIGEFELSALCSRTPSGASALLDDDSRIRLRERLRTMGVAAKTLRLVATELAVGTAVEEFSNKLPPATAYAKYRGVTQALLGELDGSKHIVLAP